MRSGSDDAQLKKEKKPAASERQAADTKQVPVSLKSHLQTINQASMSAENAVQQTSGEPSFH